MLFTVSLLLLVAGVCTLYFLNRQQQRQIAAEVAASKVEVQDAYGFFRADGRVGLNRAKMGTLESFLSFPQPLNDGYLVALPKGKSRVRFSNLSDESPPFFLATLDSQGIVLTSKWLRAEKGKWQEAPSAFKKVHVDFNSRLSVPNFWDAVRHEPNLDCPKGSTDLILLLPQPGSNSLFFYSK